MVTSAALTCSSPVRGALGGRWAHASQGIFLSLFEVNELMDLIQRDLLSANSTPLWVCLVFSCRGKRSSSGHAVRLCFGKQAKDAMPCSLAHSLMCIVILSVSSVCLSLPLSHTHATHCKIFLWCLAALSLESLQNTLESTHQTLVLGVWVDHFSVRFDHERGSSVQADTFYALGKHCHYAVCQYATIKGRWHLKELDLCGYECACPSR